MKKVTFLFILLFMTVLLKAQDYQISFTGSGQSTNVDSVFVKNQTQNTTLKLAGSDVLHLVQTVGIASQSGTNEGLQIYPNPMKGTSKLEFYNEQADNVKIEIYDVAGKLIARQSGKVHQGTNVFEISGFPSGIYTANITTSAWQKSLGFISVSEVNTPSIKSLSELMIEPKPKPLKSTKGLIQMQYNDGDRLLIKGVSGDYARVLTIVPTQTQSIDFEFVPCSDVDGNNYAVVTIGNQTWMAENLNTTHYAVGTPIPSVTGNSNWGSLSASNEAYCYFNDDSTTNASTYGALYTWSAAMRSHVSSTNNPSGVQGACPNGWHLPSIAEWTELLNYVGGESVAGGKLKETGTTHWNSPNVDATNEFGFTALPGGFRSTSGSSDRITELGMWWSATEVDATHANFVGMRNTFSLAGKDYNFNANGYSVRCVKD